ncbi:MAG TPA: hypothetical protein VGS57_11020 [Thermoanaerobaculia bacterium]|jgi:hypothetical protein|nr:hypothetical protein [Thermoanaerobaculia bacterium]
MPAISAPPFGRLAAAIVESRERLVVGELLRVSRLSAHEKKLLLGTIDAFLSKVS